MNELIVVLGLIVLVLVQIWERDRVVNEHRISFNRVCTIAEDTQRLVDKAIQKHDAEREVWRIERQQLLDRIQAPTFDHLKHHEVKVIKAKNGEKEPVPLEPL